ARAQRLSVALRCLLDASPQAGATDQPQAVAPPPVDEESDDTIAPHVAGADETLEALAVSPRDAPRSFQSLGRSHQPNLGRPRLKATKAAPGDGDAEVAEAVAMDVTEGDQLTASKGALGDGDTAIPAGVEVGEGWIEHENVARLAVGTANRRAGAYEYLVGPVPVEVEALQVAGCEPVESDAGLGGDDDLLFWCQIIASGLKLGVDVPDQRQFVERAGDQLGCVVVIEATPAWEHLREVVVEACVCRRRVQLAMSPDGL